MLDRARQVPFDQALAACVRQKDAQHARACGDVARTDVPAPGDDEGSEARRCQVADAETLLGHERLQEAKVMRISPDRGGAKSALVAQIALEAGRSLGESPGPRRPAAAAEPRHG